jgi:hypothetical protein
VRDVTGTHDGVRRAGVATLLVVLAVTIGSILTDPGEPERVSAAAPAVTPSPAATAAADPSATAAADPSAAATDAVRQILRRQAASFARGDQAGWLAAVDPAQHRRFRNLFTTLRSLGVATVDLRVVAGHPPTMTVEMSYCYPGCAAIRQQLTVRPVGDTYVIIDLETPSADPTPWEAGDLIFKQGRRVTVGAPRKLAGRLAEVVAIADRAASVDDRYAVLAGNPQSRYRIFLATDRLWRTWYGGRHTDWAVGYMQPLGAAGADVVLNPGRIKSRTALREVIQHELGHVATIGGVAPGADDMWLVEGVAEYIGAQPRRAADTYSRRALRRPARLVVRPLRDDAGRSEVAAFYAHGHFAVECLAILFGEPRAMEFVRLRLRLRHSLDAAARSVFGRPFATVDARCTGWLRDQAGQR